MVEDQDELESATDRQAQGSVTSYCDMTDCVTA